MEKDDWLDADIDDPYRRCAQCDERHHEEYGHSCDSCDEWVCENCWRGLGGETKHVETDEHIIKGR